MPLTPVLATPDNILAAANHLRAGSLVAFPTETVYGLGADARNGKAVAQIFAAKGRPAFNPLIIHVADVNAAQTFGRITPIGERLAAAFWPGGLTMVFDQQLDSGLSDLVSAGQSSIAIRVPAHPVATALLAAAGCPVAAPSANRSGHVSATTAEHVATDLDPAVSAPTLAMILDDGPCSLGLESTIIDARGETPRLLRPGVVTIEDIERVAGTSVTDERSQNAARGTEVRSSPGQLESHYAPAKPLFMNVETPAPNQALLAFGQPPAQHRGDAFNLSPSGDLIEAASNLFQALRQLDRSNAPSIAAMPIPDTGLGRAINDRLRRAAAPRPSSMSCSN